MNPVQSPTSGTGTNLTDAKVHNRRVALDAIRRNDGISRADLSRMTALSVQTISNIVDELISEDLLREKKADIRQKGKPPILLSINPAGVYSIGLHLDQFQLIGKLIDFGGTTVATTRREVNRPDPQSGVAALRECTAELISMAGIDSNKVCGIGAVMPGPFDTGESFSAGPTVLPGWQSVDIPKLLNEATRLPSYLENDATAAALGEHYFGVAQHVRNSLTLFVGTGLGGGILLDGSPYVGSRGNAGEFGHLTIIPDGKPCECGARGCAEQYLSVHSLLRHMKVEHCEHSIKMVEDMFAASDPAVAEWMAQAGPVLRHLVHNLENSFDCDAIVLTGFLNRDFLLALLNAAGPLETSVASLSQHAGQRVLIGSGGPEIAAAGAAVIPLHRKYGNIKIF